MNRISGCHHKWNFIKKKNPLFSYYSISRQKYSSCTVSFGMQHERSFPQSSIKRDYITSHIFQQLGFLVLCFLSQGSLLQRCFIKGVTASRCPYNHEAPVHKPINPFNKHSWALRALQRWPLQPFFVLFSYFRLLSHNYSTVLALSTLS